MNKKYMRLTIILIAILTIAISAQVTIDIGDIPITGQTLAILVLALLIPPIEIGISLLLYIGIGSLGLPIFADGKSGVTVLLGGSGGFILGFLLAGVIISYLSNTSRGRLSYSKILVFTTLGTILILLCGVGRLYTMYGLDKSLTYGFYPFWKGALVKIILGSIIVYAIQKTRLIKI